MTDEDDTPRGECPECLQMEKLLPAGDLRSHLDAGTGEYCAGSRGEPRRKGRRNDKA